MEAEELVYNRWEGLSNGENHSVVFTGRSGNWRHSL